MPIFCAVFFFSMSLWFNFFDVDYLVLVFALSRNDVCFSWKCIRQTRPLFLFSSFQPRPQGFSLNKWVGREKALASAGHLSFISLYKGSFTNVTARCPLYRNRRKAKDYQSQYLWQKGNLVKLFVNWLIVKRYKRPPKIARCEVTHNFSFSHSANLLHPGF